MPSSKPHVNREVILALLFLSSFLFVGCAGSNATPPVAAAPLVSATPFEKSIDVDLSSSSSISPQAKFTISNQGNDPIVMPAIVLKGNPALNRSSILFPIQGLKDEEFARATWRFVIDHRQHYCVAGTTADENQFAQEPMRLLNGFGFTCCDQSGMILTWLWQGAGYPARLVWTSFHEVPEIYYQGAWHMFDADHQVFDLQLDNKTVASTADIIANPFLVARVKDANGNDPVGVSAQFWADQYAVETPLYFDVDYKIQQIYSLQPGQSISVNFEKGDAAFHGPFFENGTPVASTGNFDWGLDYTNPNWRSLASTTSGITTVGNFLVNSEATGSAVYVLSSPFPVISLRVSGLVDLASPNSAVKAYFSTDGASWSSAFPLAFNDGISGQASADLSSAAAGEYIYFVKLEISGDSSNAARIANVHIVSEVQNSVYVFPTLAPGQVNHLTYQDWSPAPADHNVKISFEQ